MTQATDLANAINSFVVGCKQDGIWDPIKACCIMAAWDGLTGALYPLKGVAPTNNNFVAGDYDRETGLQGNGSNTSLNTNFEAQSLPSNYNHAAVYVSSAPSTGTYPQHIIAGSDPYTAIVYNSSISVYFYNQSSGLYGQTGSNNTGFIATARSTSSTAVRRANSSTVSYSLASNGVTIGTYKLFTGLSNARLSFYSIGESLDLAKLDTRVSNLMTDIGAAIP